MAYERPRPYLTNGQIIKIYNAIHRAHVTASSAVFTLHHVTNVLPMEKADGPYDVPSEAPSVLPISLHAMIVSKKEDRDLAMTGEVIACDMKFYVWLEELEGSGLFTTNPELDMLTKDKIEYEGAMYDIVQCRQTMPFFGNAWLPGTVPSPRHNRCSLAARFLTNRALRK